MKYMCPTFCQKAHTGPWNYVKLLTEVHCVSTRLCSVRVTSAMLVVQLESWNHGAAVAAAHESSWLGWTGSWPANVRIFTEEKHCFWQYVRTVGKLSLIYPEHTSHKCEVGAGKCSWTETLSLDITSILVISCPPTCQLARCTWRRPKPSSKSGISSCQTTKLFIQCCSLDSLASSRLLDNSSKLLDYPSTSRTFACVGTSCTQ